MTNWRANTCGILFFVTSFLLTVFTPAALAQVKKFSPVTREMLLNPSPGDWLMFSRTYDSQRFSPLDQVNRQNVGRLRMAWTRGMGPGIHENIPIVHEGVMYVVTPRAVVQALDATNGDLIWEYRRKLPDDLDKFIRRAGINRTVSIYEDLIFFAAPDGYVVAVDARTGKLRWETQAQDYRNGTQHTAGAAVVDGKVLSGRGCANLEAGRSKCSFIVAHDALTGKELWRFYTTPAPGEPGGDSWGNTPSERRQASAWGTPGSYDPARNLIYWGIANPKPHTRWSRHAGNPEDIPRVAPADLYSNSTVALDPNTGKLVWYYQHLPGDDWDSDHTHERILLRTRFNPDPSAVKWVNPKIPRGQERDVVVSVGEPGGLFVLDRVTGEFLWATPFPYDTPYFHISHIDGETGKTYINWEQVMKSADDTNTVCYSNTRTYPPLAYHPGNNSLYIYYVDNCFDQIADLDSEDGHTRRMKPRPGSDPNAFAGLVKVNVETGEFLRFYKSPIEGNGAMLATAGDLIFWGDVNRRFRAFDADTGRIVWETILGGAIENSTITYSVNGKQYIAVLTGDGGQRSPNNHNAIYAFALP